MFFRQQNYFLSQLSARLISTLSEICFWGTSALFSQIQVLELEKVCCKSTVPSFFDAYCLTPVIALYSKTRGKNGYHSAVPSVANIAAISNGAVQVFQQMHHRIFRQTTTAFGTRYFQILPLTHLLTRLIGKTVRSQNGNLEIGMDDLR